MLTIGVENDFVIERARWRVDAPHEAHGFAQAQHIRKCGARPGGRSGINWNDAHLFWGKESSATIWHEVRPQTTEFVSVSTLSFLEMG
jgi:hypothetical protein